MLSGCEYIFYLKKKNKQRKQSKERQVKKIQNFIHEPSCNKCFIYHPELKTAVNQDTSRSPDSISHLRKEAVFLNFFFSLSVLVTENKGSPVVVWTKSWFLHERKIYPIIRFNKFSRPLKLNEEKNEKWVPKIWDELCFLFFLKDDQSLLTKQSLVNMPHN